jgi:hypothetical protein
MTTWTQYDVVGLKEDISDVISNISPTDTPFTSAIGSESCTQKNFQWQEDALRAVQVNAMTEGFDATEASLSATVMRSNYTQILSKTIKVSGSEDKAAQHGRAKESAYQMAKAAKEVKRDLEYGYVGTKQTAVAGDNSGPVARKFAGVQAMIDSTLLIHTGGSSTPMSETNLTTAHQALYAAGVDAKMLMVTPDDSQIVAAFAAAAGRYRTFSNDADPKKIVNAVDLYVSPFGQIKVVLNRWLAAGDTLLIDTDMWKKVVFRNWFREVLAKTGDNTKQMIVGEFSLKHKNFFASALIRRVT